MKCLGRFVKWGLCLGTGGILALAGCKNNTYVPPPPPDVKVATGVLRPVTVYSEFTGTTQASATVAVRSRVQGYLANIHFVDGSDVKEGDTLFTIDPRPYQAKLDQTKADLESKKAAESRAEALYKRTLSLFRSGASNQEDVDKDRGDWSVAKAGVVQGQANVREAQLNLDWTVVRSPIAGRISRRLIDIGNLVTADSTLLTTITRYDPMYAYFTVSENDRLAYLKAHGEQPGKSLQQQPSAKVETVAPTAVGLATTPAGALVSSALGRTSAPTYPVEMGLANEKGYPHHGDLDFADNAVDPGTGTLQLRGTFRNPLPYTLAPGLFVRIRVPISSLEKALLIPERAIGTDQGGQYVLVVNGEGMVEHRPVTVGSAEGDMRIIEDGLKPNERFVIEGLQRAEPGKPVHPDDEVKPAGATANEKNTTAATPGK